MKRLFLDDRRDPKSKGWNVVRNYDQFVSWVRRNGVPDVVSFDHDLGQKKTGYDAMNYLIDYIMSNQCSFLPDIRIHTQHKVGKLSMNAAWRKLQFTHSHTTFD